MRHKKKGRRLGRTSSHRKAMLRNLAASLFLTERDDEFYEGLTQADGVTVVNPPAHKGRVTTTLQKAKEVRPLVEKCITIAKKALPAIDAASELASDDDRNSAAWKTWREGEGWKKWNAAIAPAVTARRRAFSLLRDKEAVEILFDEIAPRMEDRPGGYTRVLKLANVRLGDAGAQAILEFVGKHDRVKQKSQKPAFVDNDPAPAKEEEVKESTDEASEDAAAVATAGAAAAGAAAATEESDAEVKSPKGLGPDDLKVVEGIGPKCEEALKAGGITSWKELADSTPEKITEILTAAEGNFSGQVPTTWPKQAAMAVAGQWDELESGKMNSMAAKSLPSSCSLQFQNKNAVTNVAAFFFNCSLLRIRSQRNARNIEVNCEKLDDKLPGVCHQTVP